VNLTSLSQLSSVIAAAEMRWEQTGVPASKFQGVRFQIANNSNAAYRVVGNTSGKTITLDTTAAGFGWYIDPTPLQDVEFQHMAQSTNLAAWAGSPVAGHMDLLTVVAHELGHVLGYPDLTSGPDTLMTQDLAAGVRRLPPGAQVYVSNVPLSMASTTTPTNALDKLAVRTRDQRTSKGQKLAAGGKAEGTLYVWFQTLAQGSQGDWLTDQASAACERLAH
jgi:hypothetical protein